MSSFWPVLILFTVILSSFRTSVHCIQLLLHSDDQFDNMLKLLISLCFWPALKGKNLIFSYSCESEPLSYRKVFSITETVLLLSPILWHICDYLNTFLMWT